MKNLLELVLLFLFFEIKCVQLQFQKYKLMKNATVYNQIQINLLRKSFIVSSITPINCYIECNRDVNCALVELVNNNTCNFYSNQTSLFELIPSNSSNLMIKNNLIPCPSGILYFDTNLNFCQCPNSSYK
jgi:hypothetical protein